MIEDFINTMKDKMDKSIMAMSSEFSKIVVNRVNPSLVKDIKIDYHGDKVCLGQISVILVDNFNTLLIKPFDKKLLSMISSEIFNLGLDLNPIVFGDTVKLVFPKLTEDRRLFYIKKIKKVGEEVKVAIRNVRKNVNQKFKVLCKEENLSKDDERKYNIKIQDITDFYIKKIDIMILKKEEELLSVK